MSENIEIIAYAIVNYLPYMILALYPFKTVLRFSNRTTNLLILLALVLDVVIFCSTYQMSNTVHYLGTYLATGVQLILYFTAVQSGVGRMTYNLFMIKNVANYIMIAAKYLESRFFPARYLVPYNWTNTLCMGILILLIFPLLFRFMDTFFNKNIRDAVSVNLWKFLWLIPVHYYIVWAYLFYYGTEQTTMELATSTAFVAFMTMFLAGQMFVNMCIARLVLQFSENYDLTEKNHRLEDQSMQFHAIQNRITEITSIKHDMRHHLNVLNMYATAGEYEKLKDYLSEYTQQFPEGRIQHCSNSCLNMLAVYYDERCTRQHIPLELKFRIPEDIGLTDSEISVLFGNLLENAVDATSALPEEQRSVRCNVSFIQNNVIASITNTCANELNTDKNGLILSTKHEGHGIGTNSARKIVEDHDGSIQYECKDGTFTANLTIPVRLRK